MNETQVRMQPTPNPNSMKFVLNKKIVQSGMEMYNNKTEAEKSPVAKQIFEVTGVEGVFMMQDFISVNKVSSGNWGVIAPQVMEIIKKL
ncbi:MAG: NifU N-terminal domain-containing protein [Nitrospiria bacterium]